MRDEQEKIELVRQNGPWQAEMSNMPEVAAEGGTIISS